MIPDQEAKLKSDIDALKRTHTDTRALIREAASVLFFRYGETPTANALYQLLRKGSMTTYTDELRRFWQDIRDRTELRLAQPEVPPALLDRFGQTLAEMWTLAQQGATATLDAHRQEADQLVDEAREIALAMQHDNDRLKLTLDEYKVESARANEMREAAERRLAELSAQHEALREKADSLTGESAGLRNELSLLREEHTRKLTQIREDWDVDKDRAATEIGKLQQLLAASDETLKRLRLDVQREVDRSEAQRMAAEEARGEVRAQGELVTQLREQIAAQAVKIEGLEEKIALLRRPNKRAASMPHRRDTKRR